MPQILPIEPGEPHTQTWTVIDGTPVLFELRWNARDAAWYFDLYDQEEVRIMSGVKVVLGVHLGRQSTHPLTRKGVFVAIDLSGEARDATFDDIGTRVQIRHYTVAEVVATMQATA